MAPPAEGAAAANHRSLDQCARRVLFFAMGMMIRAIQAEAGPATRVKRAVYVALFCRGDGDGAYHGDGRRDPALSRPDRDDRLRFRGGVLPRLLRLADGHHPLPAAFAWRRGDRAAHHQQRLVDAGGDRPADAHGHRRQECDHADRFRKSNSASTAWSGSRPLSMRAASAPARSS